MADCDGIIQNNIIWSNSSSQLYQCSLPTYCCIQNWNGGGLGNISANPLLVDPLNGDLHLTDDSPCIDTGGSPMGLIFEWSRFPDMDGEWHGFRSLDWHHGDGSHFDIGADESMYRRNAADMVWLGVDGGLRK